MDSLANIRTKTEYVNFGIDEVDPYLNSPEYAAYEAEQEELKQNRIIRRICSTICCCIKTTSDTTNNDKLAYQNLPLEFNIVDLSVANRNTLQSDLESKGYTVTFDDDFKIMTIN